MRTVSSRLSTIRSLALAYIAAGSSRDKAFTLGFASIIEDAFREEGLYTITEKGQKTKDVSPIGAVRYEVGQQGSEAGVALSRLLRIRKGNRRVWNQYVQGKYVVPMQKAYRALSKSEPSKKVRIPRAVRNLMERLAAQAEKQNLVITFSVRRVK